MAKEFEGKIEQIDANRWRIPKDSRRGMRVDGIIYASSALIGGVISGGGPEQVANVATLPGIVGASLAMPDVHWGYGFCIGGVAATADRPDDRGPLTGHAKDRGKGSRRATRKHSAAQRPTRS